MGAKATAPVYVAVKFHLKVVVNSQKWRKMSE